jgi:hypothetical protein
MKLFEIRNLHAAFSMLEGYNKIVKDEKVVIPYEFSGKTRWNIAKNLRVLNVHITDFNSARDALIKQISNGTNEIDNTNKEQMNEYIKHLNEIDQQEVDVSGLLSIKVDDLALDTNPIPATVLAAFKDLVTD